MRWFSWIILFSQWKLTGCLFVVFVCIFECVFKVHTSNKEKSSFFSMNLCEGRGKGRIYELILLTDCNKSWFGLSKPVIIPKLLPILPTPMPKPNFRSFWWWRWLLWFWLTMIECWSWWCDCDCLLLLCCCWADFISWFFIFSCSSRSRRAYIWWIGQKMIEKIAHENHRK